MASIGVRADLANRSASSPALCLHPRFVRTGLAQNSRPRSPRSVPLRKAVSLFPPLRSQECHQVLQFRRAQNPFKRRHGSFAAQLAQLLQLLFPQTVKMSARILNLNGERILIRANPLDGFTRTSRDFHKEKILRQFGTRIADRLQQKRGATTVSNPR